MRVRARARVCVRVCTHTIHFNHHSRYPVEKFNLNFNIKCTDFSVRKFDHVFVVLFFVITKVHILYMHICKCVHDCSHLYEELFYQLQFPCEEKDRHTNNQGQQLQYMYFNAPFAWFSSKH